jgi:uncharacterized caspase-like protein
MLRVTVIALLIVLLPSVQSRAETRIALLIGNQGYDPSVGVLKNPYNDIAIMGQALTKQGFEVLPPVKDARRGVMLGGVRELVRRLNAGGAGAIGFIYYSGHGAAEKDTNINYLIPVDAKEPGSTSFWDESLKLDDVLRLLDGARSAAKFVVFDACRNELQLPTKDTTKGLVPVAEQQGMFIAYASSPGRSASDRGEKSGPYAQALAAELGKPGLDHLNLFQNVKEAVLAATGGAQQPWESNGLGRRIYLTGQPKPLTPAVPQSSWSEAEHEWQQYGKDTKDIQLLEAFKDKHRADPLYVRLAETRIEELRKQQTAAANPQRERPTIQSARSSKSIVPGRGIGPISVGMIESQVAILLGKSDERAVFDDGKTVYLNYFQEGLSIRFVDGGATSVFAYAGRADHYGPSKYVRYEGIFDSGLSMDSYYAEVLKKLGVPQKSGGDTEHWINYKQGIGFQFDKEGKITHVVVTAPD